MRPLVTIFTLAYNAENYIRETIESVLNQDEPNIEYVIRDNGSTDSTYAIMQEYAAKDKRIRLVRNEVNTVLNNIHMPLEEVCPEPQGEYIAWLDSDDMLEKNFVSLLYQKAKEHNADMVVAGTSMFQDGTNRLLEKRVPMEFAYHAGEQLNFIDFAASYACLRTFWGKLYRTEMYLKGAIENDKEDKKTRLANGGDTVSVMCMLKVAKCIIGIPEAYHRYRVKNQGFYTVRTPELSRIKEGELLFRYVKELLPVFGISYSDLHGCLQEIFISHVNDLIAMLAMEEDYRKETFQFCEAALNNELLTAAAEDGGLSEEWEKNIEKPVLGKVLRKKFNYDTTFDSFLQNIAVYFMEPGQVPQNIKNLYLLLGTFHKKNTFYYGIDYIEYMPKPLAPWISVLLNKKLQAKVALFNCPDVLKELMKQMAPDLGGLKMQMLDAFDSGNKEAAMELAKQILEQNPADEEGLYFGLVLAYELGEEAFLHILLDLQKRFWPWHDDLLQLAEQINGQEAEKENEETEN